jgi:hypothetical protein
MGNSSVARKPSPTSRHSTKAGGDNAVVAGRNDDHMADAAPGWYYDPDDQAIYRYWDGGRWTDHQSDVFTADRPE